MVISALNGSTGSIYVVTTEGKALQLLNGSWTELVDERNRDLRIKRISCCCTALWAICGDHQVYLRLESDVPIRVKEESYENQRWNPMDGFCNKLLPTDRPCYSSQDGLTERELNKVDLPSHAWIWDDQWHLELLFEGQHIEAEGWTYSVDFPRAYTPAKAWNSCVRRRKWVRNRRYNVLQTWARLPPIVLNDMVEPFIDIAAGGAAMPGAVSGFVAVWAVTINGLLLYREGVNLQYCPDGTGWKTVETPLGCEPCQVSVGPQGVVWILAWNGNLLARNGITWNCETGISWYEVPPPFQGLSFSHVSVGPTSTWAVSRENEVWLRKGVDSSILGSSWTAMVGQMNLVFTGTDSQVCGLLVQDQKLYLRTGIKSDECGGRTWKMLKTDDMTFVWLAFDGKGFVHRLEDSNDSSWVEPWRGEILGKLRQRHQDWQDKYAEYPTAAESTDWVKNGRAFLLPSFRSVNLSLRCCSQDPLLDVEDFRLLAVEITAIRRSADRGLVIHYVLKPPLRLTFGSEEEVEDWAAHLIKVARTARNCTGIFSQSVWALTDMGDPFAHETKVDPETSNIPYDIEITADESNQSSLFIHDIPDGFYRGCGINISGAVTANAARFSVNLQCGMKIQPHEAFTARRDVALHINPRFDTETETVEVVRNSFFNNMWDIEEKTGDFDLQPGNRFTMSIHCHKQQYLVRINEVTFTFAHRLPPFSATHLVIKGDVNLFSVSYSIPKMSVPFHALWTQLGGHFRHVEASSGGVVWALGQDGTCWIHTGFHGGGFFKSVFGSNGIHPLTDEGHVYLYENQRWNPVAGFSARGLPTDRSSWSDITGLHAYSKESMSLPNRHWSWISEWLVDYHPPDGADREGWQYATDYPSRYHAYKGSFDYVRRKRWQRKCRFTSNGPWFQFGLTKLLDVSMQVDHSGHPEEPLLLWAIAANGSILRRVGVTAAKPQGESWEAVLGEHTFQSISIGIDGRVWAITSAGVPALRHRVTTENPDGAAWLLLDRPEGNPSLRQISAGDNQVWAVDTQDRLYRRKDIVSILPEGTSWEMVEEHVLHVSVGRHDQIWVVLDAKVNEPKVKERGSIYIRRGVTASSPAGTGWEFVMGGGWSFVCNRGHDIPFS